MMDLYDAEGMLAQGEELRSDYVMALIKWQLLDFTDIVYVVGHPLVHDQVSYSLIVAGEA